MSAPIFGRAHKKLASAIISAENLADAFASDEVRAEDRFEGKRLKVRGKVYSIEKDHDNPSLEIYCRDASGYKALLVCTGYRQDEAAAIKPKDIIVIEGIFGKLPYRQFALTGCHIRERR